MSETITTHTDYLCKVWTHNSSKVWRSFATLEEAEAVVGNEKGKELKTHFPWRIVRSEMVITETLVAEYPV